EDLLHHLGLADDAGDLSQALAFDGPAPDEDDLLDVDRFGEALGEAEGAARFAARVVPGVQEPDYGKPRPLPRLGDQLLRTRAVGPAREDEEHRLTDGIRQPLSRGEQLDLDTRGIEATAQVHRRFEILGGDD